MTHGRTTDGRPAPDETRGARERAAQAAHERAATALPHPPASTARHGATSAVVDRATIVAAIGGDRSAFALLVRMHLRKAMAIAIEFMPTREDAEDVVQDAFQAAFASLHRFDAARPFAPWFFTIVRNTARNALASRRLRKHEPLSPTHPARSVSPLESAHRRELRRAIEEAIAALPETQRTCFRLCMVEGLTNLEAASATGLAASTVRVHIFRARKTLRKLLERWRDSDE